MTLSLILAAARNGVIGKDGQLPWRLPGDLAFFKKTTIGHPVIMGRKTFESIGRPLPGRQNIVVSRNPNFKAEGIETAASLEEALKLAGSSDEVFVIGGESLFAEALPRASKVYLTKVDAEVEGDRFFHFDPTGWKQVFSQKHAADSKNQYRYELTVWVKA